MNLLNIEQGKAKVLTQPLTYQASPLNVFAQFAQQRPNCMLLESAEINSKRHTQSILLLDSALRFECNGQSVEITPLTINGHSVLPYLVEKLKKIATVVTQEHCVTATFAAPNQELDEDSRLKLPSPFDALRCVINGIKTDSSEPHGIFLGGVFAYDLIAATETLPTVEQGDNDCPDFVFYLAETLLQFDHITQNCQLLATVFGGEFAPVVQMQMATRCSQIAQTLETQAIEYQSKIAPAVPFELAVNTSDSDFCAQVEKLKQHIFCGDIFQVVPSRSFNLPCPDPLLAYRELRSQNPSPYMFYLQDQNFTLFGASPESAVKFCSEDRSVEVYPIAGTRRRGFNADGTINADLDSRMELDLRLDQKELSEHLMLVDLARNDIAKIAKAGTRHVADLLKVDRYSYVMHLVSRVAGTLREDLDSLHAYQACMNMGTLTGAPKIQAATLIRQVEGKRRGAYGGAVGYINGSGSMNTCIVIRSAFVKNGTAQIQAGAGVVFDSIPQAEADETRNKAQAVISAISNANALLNQQNQGA